MTRSDELTSRPTLRATYHIVDPVLNATSTSVSCNTDALSAYQEAPGYFTCKDVTLNDECELVCHYLHSFIEQTDSM